MTTLLTLTDWLAGLNRWQITLITTGALIAWIGFMLGLSRFFGGGNGPDADDEEAGR